MEGMVSLLLATAIAATLAAIGFWAWRRSARSNRPVLADASPVASAPNRIAAQSKAETAGSVQTKDASDLQDVRGYPTRGLSDDTAAAGVSIGNAGAQVLSPEIVLPAPHHKLVDDDLPQDAAGERSVAEGLSALPTPPPTLTGVPPDEEAKDRPLHDGGPTAETEEGSAAEGSVLAPMKPPVSEARPGADEPFLLPIASGPAAPDIADTNISEAQPADDVVDNIEATPARPEGATQEDPLGDSIAINAMPPPLPTEPQGVGDGDADLAPGLIDLSGQEDEPEAAATSEDREQTDADSPLADPTSETVANPPSSRPSRPAIHRDRRGGRRVAATASTLFAGPPILPGPAVRPPAEITLRLSLHPIRRTAKLSVVLARPDGFPHRVTLHIDGQPLIEAYNARRYDDLDLPWTGELLNGEIRIASADGLQWLRSARQVHIFAEDPNEPGLISVGAARAGVTHTLICRSSDAATVRAAATSTGSAQLTDHGHWQGIPAGWTVLSGYSPVQAAVHPLAAALRPLDPGAGIEIGFEGGLAVRQRVFAQGHPPRIAISPEPVGASVTIGGQPAALAAGGGWEASGWDTPGQHMIDVVPGPSATYVIAADPWGTTGWEFWDAHAGRFGDRAAGPWARAEICGASIRGPAGQAILAVETQPTLIALGSRSGAVPLVRRNDFSVSVGFVHEPPAFLFSATGQRRSQGRVIWLGLTLPALSSRRPDSDWAATVRVAASRRLPLQGADALGEDAWRKAKERARRLRRPRR